MAKVIVHERIDPKVTVEITLSEAQQLRKLVGLSMYAPLSGLYRALENVGSGGWTAVIRDFSDGEHRELIDAAVVIEREETDG